MKKFRMISYILVITILLSAVSAGLAQTYPQVTIMEIQGNGQYSPYLGQTVETTGIVTLITANGRDMWIQDFDGDGDPSTSDGIFVDDRNRLDPLPQVGDLVRITGEVEELQFGNALPLTRIDDPDDYPFEIISSGNLLPAPVPLFDLPNLSIQDGINFWEPLEGMLVSIQNGFVVFPTNQFGEFVMLTETDADAELMSGYYAQTKQILLVDLPGDEVDYNPERIMVDDSSLFDPIQVMPGDRVRSLVGVVDYTFGNYKLQPVSFEVKNHNLPKMPVSNRTGDFGDTVITSFNVENLFDMMLNTPTYVDVIGQVGFDPGSEWGSGDTSTQNNTIRRLSSVCQGDTDPLDAFDPLLEWEGFPQNTFDGLGAHTETCGTATDLFISEYVEGSSLNKALEIYNGTGVAVNLAKEAYVIDIYFNGQTSPGTSIPLTGILAAGDVYVVADDGADPAILAVADLTSTSNFFNGDDAVVLRKGGKDDAGSTPSASELETKLTKLALAFTVELGLPDIAVVQEVENTEVLTGDDNGYVPGSTSPALLSRLPGSWDAVSFETSDGRGIEVAFIWNTDNVTLLDAYQMSGPDVEAWFGPSSPSPGREPLVGMFAVNGKTITIIGNHFKSKGGDDPLFGVNWPPFRVTEFQRKGQATVVRDFVDTILDADPNALVMVAGDLNDFQFSEPGEGADHPVAILEGINGGIPLINLINMEKPAETYSYLFDGNSQVLDHMLVSPALYQYVVAADILHFNASFPNEVGEDPSTTIRASDHDPVEGRFILK